MVKLENKNGKELIANNGKFIIVSEKKTATYHNFEDAVIAFYELEYQLDIVSSIVANTDLAQHGLFKCIRCNDVYDTDERCTKHYDSSDNVCVYCCEDCRKEEIFFDNIDLAINEQKLL